jgi:hypothetical protein
VGKYVEDARIVCDAKTAFFDNLRYDFNYNESENVLEVSYWFLSAVPDEAASIVSFETYARTMRYQPPRYPGQNPSLVAIFDDPEKMRQLGKRAEALFAQDFGWAIDIALQLLVHRTMYRCGAIKWRKPPKLMTNLLAGAYRKDTAKELGVRNGRSTRFRDADHYRQTLVESMQDALRTGEITSAQQFTQDLVAQKITKRFKSTAFIDDRMIRHWNSYYDVHWRKFVNETWTQLTKNSDH